MGKILVTGGCGYIGSHTVVDLLDNGYRVIIIDDLSNSSEEVLDGIESITGIRVPMYKVDLKDKQAVLDCFSAESDIEGIVHFAAYKSVEESTRKPLGYFENNIKGLMHVLEGVQRYDIPHFIFSSSCTVYGQPDILPVTEQTPMQETESPYGRTKLIGEFILKDISGLSPLQTISLRYFNPAGAHETAEIGEDPINKASNLVPIITETAIGKREKMTVYGDDYDTRDGTCIRDYIHIMDLAAAHTKALDYLRAEQSGKDFEVFNLGIGEGVTVLEAIHAFEQVTGETLNYEIGDRRPGDVEAIYANYSKAGEVLGWEPRRDIEDIMRTAWEWEEEK